MKKTGRAAARSATRVIAGEQGAQRSVVVERRVVRRFGNDKRTGPETLKVLGICGDMALRAKWIWFALEARKTKV